MFSKVKAWLRSIIAEEVAKVSVSLTKERAEAIATFKNVEKDILHSLDSEAAALKLRITALIEAEHTAFETRLRQTREHISNGEPNTWRADDETLAADHALRLRK